jgi:hypothetical protein
MLKSPVGDRRLEEIRTAVERSLGRDASARMGFYLRPKKNCF